MMRTTLANENKTNNQGKIRRKNGNNNRFWTQHKYKIYICHVSLSVWVPRSGELRTQKFKSHMVRTQSLNVLPLKPGVGQYIAIHATLTARNFFLTYFYPSSPFTCIFSQTSPDFFPGLLCLTPVPV